MSLRQIVIDKYVVLEWPDGRDTDYDLHASSVGEYYSEFDCYRGNAEPDWLFPGLVSGDARGGPRAREQVRFVEFEPGVYTVGGAMAGRSACNCHLDCGGDKSDSGP